MNIELEARIKQSLDLQDYDQALKVIETGYGPEIFGFICSRIEDLPRAEDAYADFTERVCKGIRGFRQGSAFRTWAYVIARRAVIDAIRSRTHELPVTTLSKAQAVLYSAKQSSFASARKRYEALRQRLNAEEQELLTLRIDREMDYCDIAVILSSSSPDDVVTEVTLRQRFKRLVKKLRLLYQEGLLHEESDTLQPLAAING